ncbi:MAG: hypothetical protein P9X26_09855 [Candidatus Stygibacter frigidus]|nr:hypothetical protein [Candidatus Stygibacter frigidus]
MKNIVYIILLISILALTSCTQKQPDASSLWHDGYCRQDRVVPVNAGDKMVAALVDGKWKEFEIVQLPESFIEWNKGRRIGFLEDIQKGRPELAGPHNGIVATCGYRRSDASFSLNNAVKGMGFLPKPEKMEEMIALLDSTVDADFTVKLAVLTSFYENLEDNFDLTKQGSLELYSQPEFMTQSFLNQMYNPESTIVYLDIPSYKLKTIARLIDPNDPNLTAYEKQVVTWINKIHNYFHGPFNAQFIGVIYNVIEVFDNSPRGRDPKTGMGRRLMPLLP